MNPQVFDMLARYSQAPDVQYNDPVANAGQSMRGPSPLDAFFGAMSQNIGQSPDYREQAAQERAQGQQYQTQAANVRQPGQMQPAFRSTDLIPLALALMSGQFGGDVLQGAIGAKLQKAQTDTQTKQQNAELQRQNLSNQANAHFQAAQGLMNAANTQDLIKGRADVAGINQQGKIQAAQIGAETKKAIAEQASQDRVASSMLNRLMQLPPEARPGFAKVIKKQLGLDDWSDDDIQDLAAQTANEQYKIAQAATQKALQDKYRADVGFLGAKTKRIEELTPMEGMALKAKVNKINADANKAMAAKGLAEAQQAQIRQKMSLYEPDLRSKWAINAARTQVLLNQAAKAQQSGNKDDTIRYFELAKNSLKASLSVAKEQSKRIVDANNGNTPKEGDDLYPSYKQAVDDEMRYRQGIDSITQQAMQRAMQPKAQTAPQGPSVNPVTQRSMQPTRKGGRTRSGVSWSLN